MHLFHTSPWLPVEWVKAHGLEPRGVWFAEDFGRQSLPLAAGVCAFANAALHLVQKRPDSAFLFTTHCDQLRREFDTLADTAPKRTFLFNLPATWQTPAAAQLFTAEMERLGRFLVTLGGQSPTADELHRIMLEHAAARTRLLEAATSLPARQYAEALARFHWDGSVQLEPERGRPRPQQSINSQTAAVPLALLGGPLPRSQWGLLDTLERAGGRVVLNATEAGERSLWRSVTPAPVSANRTAQMVGRSVPERRDSPKGQDGTRSVAHDGALGESALPQLSSAYSVPALLAELARTYLEHCVDMFQRPNTRLYDWLRDRLQSRGVRGLVVWHYVGCDLWRAEVQSLRETFGLPVLLLDAVAAAEDSPRNVSRVEAFLEALQ